MPEYNNLEPFQVKHYVQAFRYGLGNVLCGIYMVETISQPRFCIAISVTSGEVVFKSLLWSVECISRTLSVGTLTMSLYHHNVTR